MLKYQHCNFAVFFEGGIALGDMKDREHNTLSGDGLDEELSQIRDAFQQELEEATKRAEQEAEKNAQSGKEETPPALPTSPVRAEGEAANAAVSAGEQKADWKVIVLAVIVAFVALYGAADFFIGVSPFARVLQAEQYVRQGKLNSALDAYYDASQDTTAAAAKRMVKGQAQLYLNLGYVENAQSLIKKYYTTAQLERAWNRDLNELYQNLNAITDTISAVEELFSGYSEVGDDQLPYDELIEKIEGLKENESYDKAILEYYKYMLAAMTEQESSVRIQFLESVQKENESYSWIYLPAMATEYLEAKNYDKVVELCDQMRAQNVEDASAYGTEASVYRLQKEYDKAISTAEKGIALDDTSSEPYRQKAIVELLQGDKKAALANAQTAFDLSLNYATSYTLAVCYLANGNQDGYEEVISTLEYYGVEMGQKVLDYKAGKLTVEDIFLNGEGDVA